MSIVGTVMRRASAASARAAAAASARRALSAAAPAAALTTATRAAAATANTAAAAARFAAARFAAPAIAVSRAGVRAFHSGSARRTADAASSAWAAMLQSAAAHAAAASHPATAACGHAHAHGASCGASAVASATGAAGAAAPASGTAAGAYTSGGVRFGFGSLPNAQARGLSTAANGGKPAAAAGAAAGANGHEEISPDDLSDLLANNQKWADGMVAADPQFFKRLENVQRPQYLWIGCSDSRVPANTIIGKLPGEVFVHRNVANCVVHTDLNLLSVLQFAIDVLKVRHVIVAGHYQCGGVKAAMSNQQYGLVDNWIRHVRDVYFQAESVIDALPEAQRLDRLCEEHTREQTFNVCRTQIVQNAWQRGQQVSVNGFIYRLSDGKLVRLVEPITCVADARLSSKFRVIAPAPEPQAAQLVTPKWPPEGGVPPSTPTITGQSKSSSQ